MSDPLSHPLLTIIKDQKLIDDLQLEEVIEEHNRSGKPIGAVLADFGLMDLDTQLELVAASLGTQVVSLRDKEFPPEVLKVISGSNARMYQALPVAVYGNTVQIALADPMNPATIDELGYI